MLTAGTVPRVGSLAGRCSEGLNRMRHAAPNGIDPASPRLTVTTGGTTTPWARPQSDAAVRRLTELFVGGPSTTPPPSASRGDPAELRKPWCLGPMSRPGHGATRTRVPVLFCGSGGSPLCSPSRRAARGVWSFAREIGSDGHSGGLLERGTRRFPIWEVRDVRQE